MAWINTQTLMENITKNNDFKNVTRLHEPLSAFTNQIQIIVQAIKLSKSINTFSNYSDTSTKFIPKKNDKCANKEIASFVCKIKTNEQKDNIAMTIFDISNTTAYCLELNIYKDGEIKFKNDSSISVTKHFQQIFSWTDTLKDIVEWIEQTINTNNNLPNPAFEALLSESKKLKSLDNLGKNIELF